MRGISIFVLAVMACLSLNAPGATLSRATLSVSDADASLAFYRDLLGFTVSSRAAYDTPAMRRMFAIPEGSTPTLILLDASD
ncbi:MAG: VOC family protein, partial [Chromatocurvus sp.]